MDPWLKQFLKDAGIRIAETFEEVKNSDSIAMIDVERYFIERKITWPLVNRLRESGKELKSRLIISFNGYETDPREVFHIPEIRRWVKSIYKQVPHLFYFLASDLEGMKPIFLCLADTSYTVRVENSSRLSSVIIEADKLVKEIVLNALKFSVKMNETGEEQRELIHTILNGVDIKRLDKDIEGGTNGWKKRLRGKRGKRLFS